jgi:2-dehydro-3-deoxyphosphogluconate aldolase/(4S)-4-hydroxy-2-oxoglutarate aldolase
MNRAEVAARIERAGLIAVIRADTVEQALRTSEACRQGGAAAVEITFTVPGAAKAIEALASAYASGDILVGAGTVLDSETARVAILAGATFVVSPCLRLDVLHTCNRYATACMPGAMTVRDVVEALEGGADLVKAFPGEVLGPAFIKAVRGPLPQARLVPTGGVSVDNVGEWIRAGSAAVGVGGNLTAGARAGDYEAVTTATRRFVEAIAAARG